MLRREGIIDQALINKLLGSRHSGFSIHHQVRIDRRDQRGQEKLTQYIPKAPFSLEKMRCQPTRRTVIYRSQVHGVLKRSFEAFSVLDGIAAVTAHIPNKGEHLLRYYGWYSNVDRGKRHKAEEPAPHASLGYGRDFPAAGLYPFKQRWAGLIK